MTDLEKAVAKALRLSNNAAALLLDEIQRNIDTARAELIRSGVSSDLVTEEGALVVNAIITFCQMNMSSEDLYVRYFEAFNYQCDNLRKS